MTWFGYPEISVVHWFSERQKTDESRALGMILRPFVWLLKTGNRSCVHDFFREEVLASSWYCLSDFHLAVLIARHVSGEPHLGLFHKAAF